MNHLPANRLLRALTNGMLLLVLVLTSSVASSAVAAPPAQPHLAPLPAHLFVSSFDTDQVLRYHGSSGTFLDVFASGGLDDPIGLAFGPDGNLYVSSSNTDQVLRYDGVTGAFLDVFASGGGLDLPAGLVFGPDGNLYVSSHNTDQVLRYHGSSGAFLDVFASGGGLDDPIGLTFGPDGNLYVSSYNTDQVLRYDGLTGAFLDVFASGGGLNDPVGLTFGPDGNLYVSSYSTDQVLRYDGLTGAFLDVFASGGGLDLPAGLVFGPDGNLYVSSINTDQVLRYDGLTGAFLDVFASGGGLNWPFGLTFAPLADLSVVQTATPDPAVAGEPLTYVLTVANAGPDTAVGVGVTVTLPAQAVYIADTAGCSDPDPGNRLFCVLDPIPAGAQFAFQVRVGLPADLVAAEPDGTALITATAEVRGVGGEPETDNNRATCVTLVTDRADLSVVKTSSPETTVRAGERFTYTIFVENHGPSAARQVALRDDILSDGAFTLVDVLLDPNRPDSGPSYLPAPPGGVSMEFTLDEPLEPQTTGGDGRWAIQIVVQANEAQQVSNSVQAFTRTGGTPDPNPLNNQTADFIAVTDVADLTLTKGVLTAGPWRAGTNVQFRLGLTNGGPSAAEGVVLQDFLPASVTLVSFEPPAGASCTAGTPGDPFAPLTCNLGALPSGAATALTVTVRIAPDFPTSVALRNDGWVSAATFDPNIGDNRASASLTVSAEADLSIGKQDAPDPATAGDVLEYTLTVGNAGPSTARQVEVTDNLPAEAAFVSAAAIGWPTASCTYQAASHSVTCALGDVDPAETVRLLIRVRVDSDTPHGTVLTNTAAVSSSVSDPQAGNNQATATTAVVARADLRLQKTADPTLATAGGVVAYTLSVTNDGPSDAPAVVMTDTLPASLTYEMDNAGCLLIATGPDVLRCSLGGLPVTASRTVTVWARVSPAATPGAEPVNTATAASAAADPDPADNTATAAVRVQGQADLRLALFGNPAGTVRAGERLTYTAIVDNLGPGFAHAVVLHDLVQSDGSFDLLAVSSDRPAVCAPTGGSFTGRLDLRCTLSAPLEVRTPSTAGRWVVTVTVAAAQAQALTSLADVLGMDPDADLTNNQAVAQHQVSQAADLRVGQVVFGQVQVDGQPGGTFALQADRVTAGGALTYTLLVTNDGPSAAERVALQDRLPSWITQVAATPEQGYCTRGTPGDPDRPLACNLGSLAPGHTVVVTVTARVPPWVAAGGELYNEALAYSDTFDPDNTNDFAAHTTVVDAWADLAVTKTALPPQALPGQVITYTITVRNTGPSDAPSALVSDPPPPGLYAPSWTCAPSGGASCTASGSGGIADTVNLPAGASVVYTLRATLTTIHPVTNTATATPLAPVQDPYTDNNTAEASNLIPGGVYLPLVMVGSAGGTPAPDLVIEQLLVTSNDIRLVIRNRGSMPVTRAFWVDVYLNPISAPREVNQVWYMLGNQGLVWGVTAAALPLESGEMLSLSVGDDYYSPGLSQVIWPLLPGTRVYAQVDSYCATTSYGTVLESHEITGEPYNNIIGPVLSP